MNSNELKEQFLAAGASEDQLAKIDFDKILEIIDKSSNIEELTKAMKDSFVDFDDENFKKVVAEYKDEGNEAIDLSDDDLESVAGGSLGSWMSENKDWLIPVAVVVGIGVTGFVAGKLIQNHRQAVAKKAFLNRQPERTTVTSTPNNTPEDLNSSLGSIGNTSFLSNL